MADEDSDEGKVCEDEIESMAVEDGPRRFLPIELQTGDSTEGEVAAEPPMPSDYAIKWNFNEAKHLSIGDRLRECRPKMVAVYMRKEGRCRQDKYDACAWVRAGAARAAADPDG
jgi:hypothetical protein